MNVNLLTFILDKSEKLIIVLDEQNDIIDCCYRAAINLNVNNEQIVIGNERIQDYIEGFQKLLPLALSNRLKLHASIKKNIGYYWNQRMNEENPDLFFKQGKEDTYWVGSIYYLWSTTGKSHEQYSAWIYNDAQGNIIFEVTPIYPDTYIDQQDPVNLQEYQDWMATSYKPFFTRIIPKEVAMQWLDQANLILKDIHDKITKNN